jgi:hypothetical protein
MRGTWQHIGDWRTDKDEIVGEGIAGYDETIIRRRDTWRALSRSARVSFFISGIDDAHAVLVGIDPTPILVATK